MRFLLIAGYPDSLINFRGALIAALIRRGLDVHVAAPGLHEGAEVRHRLEALGVGMHDIPLQRTGTSFLGDIRAFLALLALMLRLRPHYVMAYTIKPVIYGLLAACFARVPNRVALITGLGYAFGEAENSRFFSTRSGVRALVQVLYAMSLRTAKVVFFQNPDDQGLFRSTGILGRRTRSVVVNGSGVDVRRYAVAPFPKGEVSFLLIARLLGDKGIREYVEAACIIKRKHPGVMFRLVGWVDDNPDAIRQEELDAWVANGFVDYLGRLDDVRPAIAGCSVYVLPSYREGTPRTVLEAMAMGRPIITTDAPGCRETVVSGGNGFMVPVRSAVALAEAMEAFVLAPERCEEMGRRSRQITESKYDVDSVNLQMLHEMGVAK